MSLIITSVKDSIGTIVLNNLPKRDALSATLLEEMTTALAAMVGLEVRVVILRTPPGTRVWSAGHDVHELPRSGRDPLHYNDPLRRAVRTIQEHPHPVIAMIEGGVWGGACELVLSCDLVIASTEATFTITPARLGVPYNLSGILNFMRSASLPIIKEAFFTAQPIAADRAMLADFVNCVLPVEQLEDFTYNLAKQIAQNSPLVVSTIKEELRVLSEAAPLNPEAFERVQALRRRVYDSQDYQEGIQAFLEKRKPNFVGK